MLNEASHPVGILTTKDLMIRVVAQGMNPIHTCVNEILPPPPESTMDIEVPMETDAASVSPLSDLSSHAGMFYKITDANGVMYRIQSAVTSPVVRFKVVVFKVLRRQHACVRIYWHTSRSGVILLTS